ncbi:MAG: MerR family transcriptional regulator [Gemmatimonadota bacterium]|nr:MAG: MerR family transcriptional regulator [Gemmatimonadota bacterium]
MTLAGVSNGDPLATLREYRQLAPWNLHDLATVAGAILESSGVRPINAAATPRPNERTIRFYVTRGLVTPPEGRGTAAVYTYRHLLQVLSIKLRQMEGTTLADIATELREVSGDMLERRVAAALGGTLPPPRHLPLTSEDRPAWGRSGRALRAWLSEDHADRSPSAGSSGGTTWRRILISRGVELHVNDTHPLVTLGDRDTEISDAVRLAVARVLGQDPSKPQAADGAGRNADQPRTES